MLTMSILRCETLNVSNEPIDPKNPAGSYHHGDLRRALIAAALELSAERQDWNFSLRELARRAGVSHNAPYNHFAHKNDLMAAAATAGHALLRGELASAVAKTQDPRSALLKMGAAYVKFGLGNAALYQLMFTAALGGPNWQPETVVAAGEGTRTILEDIFRDGAAKGLFPRNLSRRANLQAAALCAWSAVHGLTMLAIDGLARVEHNSIERLTDKILAMILHGLSPQKH